MELFKSTVVAMLLLTNCCFFSYAADEQTLKLLSSALEDHLGQPLTLSETEIARQLSQIIDSKFVISPITGPESESGLTYSFDKNSLTLIQATTEITDNQLLEIMPKKVHQNALVY